MFKEQSGDWLKIFERIAALSILDTDQAFSGLSNMRHSLQMLSSLKKAYARMIPTSLFSKTKNAMIGVHLRMSKELNIISPLRLLGMLRKWL